MTNRMASRKYTLSSSLTTVTSTSVSGMGIPGGGTIWVLIPKIGWARSLRHLIDTVFLLQERGIGFKSLQEQINTTTNGGKLVFHVFGALAEFDRDLIRER